MNIVFLIGGGNNINHQNNIYPIYMAEIYDEIMLEKQITYYKKMNPCNMVFCILKDDILNFNVDKVIQQSTDQSICVEISSITAGAVCTALLAAEHLDNNDELVLVATDELITSDPVNIVKEFRHKKCDAGVVSFRSVHPRYSFAKIDNNGFVSEVAEKKTISQHALASFYYFKLGHEFIECAKNVIRKNNMVNNNFYLSQAINEMILLQKRVGIHHIPRQEFYPLKTEVHLTQYLMKFKDQGERST